MSSPHCSDCRVFLPSIIDSCSLEYSNRKNTTILLALQGSGLLYVRADLVIKILYSVHTVISVIFMILRKTSISSLYRIGWLNFIIVTEFVYCAVRSESV